MQPLSGLDATFLYLETATTHMHVGSVGIYEGSLAYETFRRTIAERIHMLPRLRQRLVNAPLGIDRPYWVDDPDFNIDLQLQHIALPQPGGWKELRRLASSIFSEPLDRSRPLWQLTFVEGLNTIPQVVPGSVALISKVHHAAIDGVSGNDIMTVLLDPTPAGREIPPAQPFKPEPLPGELGVAARSALNFALRPLKLPRLLAETAVATAKAGYLTRTQGLSLPTVPFTAPQTRLNNAVSPQRNWNTAILSLDRVRAIKKEMETSVNDVILAICGGALRRYLLEENELPTKSLVAMVPVSTRSKAEEGALGNQVSAMLIRIGTEIEDPLERLASIHQRARDGKMYQHAVGAKRLADFYDFAPYGLSAQAARLYVRYDMSERHNPAANLTITNVPGPQQDLYLAGHRLLAIMGTAPIFDGMGMIITALSYNGVLTLSPTSSPKLIPDIDRFTRYLWESANELEAAVAKRRATAAAPQPAAGEAPVAAEQAPAAAVQQPPQPADEPRPVIVTEPEPPMPLSATGFFLQLQQALAANPDVVADTRGVFQFDITGSDPRNWVIDLDSDPAVVLEGKVKKPDARFIVRDDHFVKLLAGELRPQMALIQGKVRVKGDLQKAMKLAPLLPQFPELFNGSAA